MILAVSHKDGQMVPFAETTEFQLYDIQPGRFEAQGILPAGGGRFFGKVGRFEPGYAFDAVVIDDSASRTLRTFSPAERIERCAYLLSSRVTAKYVDGSQVL